MIAFVISADPENDGGDYTEEDLVEALSGTMEQIAGLQVFAVRLLTGETASGVVELIEQAEEDDEKERAAKAIEEEG